MNISQSIFLNNRKMFISIFSPFCRNNYSPVVTGMNEFLFIAIIKQCFDDSLQLPGSSGTGGIIIMPGNIYFEGSILVWQNILLVVS